MKSVQNKDSVIDYYIYGSWLSLNENFAYFGNVLIITVFTDSVEKVSPSRKRPKHLVGGNVYTVEQN